MLFLDSNGIYRAESLSALAWIEHGFGTAAPEWPPRHALALVKQVHSATIREAFGPGPQGEADALVTAQAGLLVGVKTADCVPVLLADTEHHTVAAIHAGWKGTASLIAVAALNEMRVRYGTRPQAIVAAIGPSIQSCCYEVGPEVAARFRSWLPGFAPDSKHKLDLVEINRRQLISAGVPQANIESGGPCTFCGPRQWLHSFRRDGERAGRMISAIGIRP